MKVKIIITDYFLNEKEISDLIDHLWGYFADISYKQIKIENEKNEKNEKNDKNTLSL